MRQRTLDRRRPGFCVLMLLAVMLGGTACQTPSEKKVPAAEAPQPRINSVTCVQASPGDGVFRVRVDLPDALAAAEVSMSSRIRIIEHGLGERDGKSGTTPTPRRLRLGNTMFYEVPSRTGCTYQVRFEGPGRAGPPPAVDCSVLHALEPPFLQLEIQQDRPVLVFDTSIYGEDLSRDGHEVTITNCSYPKVDDEIQPAVLGEPIHLFHDPFSARVHLQFPESMEISGTSKEGISIRLPRDLTVIHDYHVSEREILLEHTGVLDPVIEPEKRGFDVTFPNAFFQVKGPSPEIPGELIQTLDWHETCEGVKLSLLFQEGTSGWILKLVPQDKGSVLKVEKVVLEILQEPPVETEPEESGKSLHLEPVTSFGRKGFEAEDLYKPNDVAAHPNGNLYVVDTLNHRIKIFNSEFRFMSSFGEPGTKEGAFKKPSAVAVGSGGLIYVADMLNNRIQVFEDSGKFVRSWGTYGKDEGQLANPLGLDVDSRNRVYVVDMNHRVSVFDAQGALIDTWGGPGSRPGEFSIPNDVAWDAEARQLYVADSGNHRIQVLSEEGEFLEAFSKIDGLRGGLVDPSGIALRGGAVYVSDAGRDCLVVLDKARGHLLKVFGKEGSGIGSFSEPRGIGLDRGSHIFVADRHNHRIQVIEEQWTIEQ